MNTDVNRAEQLIEEGKRMNEQAAADLAKSNEALAALGRYPEQEVDAVKHQLQLEAEADNAVAAKADTESKAKASAAAADAANKIKKLETDRDAKLESLSRRLDEARDQLSKAPPDSDLQRSAQTLIATLAAERLDVKSKADKQIAALQSASSDNSLLHDAPSASTDSGHQEFDLHKPGPITKFPDWHGPWKVCPVCGGTGHTQTSRDQTQQDVSPLLAQSVGTGTSSTIKNGVSYCEYCGGAGQVPDR
jgi:DNA repair exonuclease SbcCD ATPase subunit